MELEKTFQLNCESFGEKNEKEKANFLEANCHEICLPFVLNELALIGSNQTANADIRVL